VALFAVVAVAGLLHGGGTVGIVLILVDYAIRYGLMSNLFPLLKALGTPPVDATASAGNVRFPNRVW